MLGDVYLAGTRIADNDVFELARLLGEGGFVDGINCITCNYSLLL